MEKKPNRFWRNGHPKGMLGKTPWNKDLTKETDERMMRISEKTSKTRKRLFKEGKLKSKRKLNLDNKKVIHSYLNGKSAIKIAKSFGCSYIVIYRVLRENKVKIRTIKESNKGLHNSPKTEFKKGQSPWNKNKPLSKKHKKSLSKSHRGMRNSPKTEFKKEDKRFTIEWRKKLFESRIKKPTKPEIQFMNLVKKYNLPYKYVGDGKFWIENINPDFVDCNGQKVAVEIFGDYWHDPKQRKNLEWNKTEKGRKKILAKYGWKCIVIWEKELKNLSDKAILIKLGGFLK